MNRRTAGLFGATAMAVVLSGCGRSQLRTPRDGGETDVLTRCSVDSDCGNPCTGGGVCLLGTCNFLPPLDCSDDIDCTVDTCDPAGGCARRPDDLRCPPGVRCDATRGCVTDMTCASDAQCDNLLQCDGIERCVVGLCVAGTPRDCSDGLDCTEDACDLARDACVSVPNAARCPVGMTCDPAAGCVPTPTCGSDADCDDLFFCNGLEACSAGRCVPSATAPCDDRVGCTFDRCSESARSCEQIPVDALCDDGLYCNGTAICDPAMGCLPDRPSCTDGDACTADLCDESMRTCTFMPLPPDGDSDGFASVGCGGTDCDDANSAIHPGAAESCTNGADDDCDGATDCPDTDCDGVPICGCRSYENCTNGYDDNCSGSIDCNDGLCLGASVCAVNGDTCANPRNVSGGALVNESTFGFGSQYSACGSSGGPDRVFYFVLHDPSSFAADVISASFNSVLYVRSPACTTVPALACNAGTTSGTQASLAIPLLLPGTYYLFLDGDAEGPFILRVTMTRL